MILDGHQLPASITLDNGKVLVATLLRIHSRDEQNRPESLTLLPEDRPVEVVHGDEFLICYVEEKVLGL